MQEAANDSLNNVVEFPTQQSTLGSRLAWLIWFTAASFILFKLLIQFSSGIIIEQLMESFSLTAFGGGLLASVYYYVYVMLQVPAGFLIDRYGTRRMLSTAATVCGLGCFIFATAHYIMLAAFGRLLMGAGASFAFVGTMSLIARWFSSHRFGFMTAMTETLGMGSSLFGSYALAHLVQRFGWRSAMEEIAALALLIAMSLAIIIRNAPKHTTRLASANKRLLCQDFKSLVKKPVIWLNGIYCSAMFSIITVFVALWGVPFMQKVHHLSLSQATLLCNLMFVGVAFGTLLIGWLDSHIRSRRTLMITTAVIASIILFILIYDTTLSILIAVALMLLLGLMTSSYVASFIISNQVSGQHTRGSAAGITNMLCVGSAPILQPFVGLMLYLLSDHQQQTSFIAYEIGHFQLALSIIPIVVVVAGIIAFWLPNRKS